VETIRHSGEDFIVQEHSRPEGWSCRHLISADRGHQFLEYLISVGPFKIDAIRIHKLSSSEIEGQRSGALHLGELARQLAEEDERPVKQQRTGHAADAVSSDTPSKGRS
jgi:hypothetical protein